MPQLKFRSYRTMARMFPVPDPQRNDVPNLEAPEDASLVGQAQMAVGEQPDTAKLSHELRNALGAISAAAEVLSNGSGGQIMMQKAIAVIVRQCRRASVLLEQQPWIQRE